MRTSTRPAPAISRAPSKLRFADLSYVGSAGLRGRLSRTLLSALGVAIGIGAMIGVVGVSASSQNQLNEQLAALGTNLLAAAENNDVPGALPLPADSSTRLSREAHVLATAQVAYIDGIGVYRNAWIPKNQTGGITLMAATLNLPEVVAGTLRSGRWINEATATLPAVVLGDQAARRLAIRDPGALIWVGDTEAVVVGILHPVTLAPELDSAAIVGETEGDTRGSHSPPSRLYVRVAEGHVPQTRDVLPSAIQPQSPGSVAVSRPSDVLTAAAAANSAFTGLLLAVGAIALVVGGVGVANTMVVTVLERRPEIGLRRALGATRGHIRLQFLTESLLLTSMGGLGGAIIGVAATAVIALANGWTIVIPPVSLVAGLGATVLVGSLAGIYPAVRASKTTPTSALTS